MAHSLTHALFTSDVCVCVCVYTDVCVCARVPVLLGVPDGLRIDCLEFDAYY